MMLADSDEDFVMYNGNDESMTEDDIMSDHNNISVVECDKSTGDLAKEASVSTGLKKRKGANKTTDAGITTLV